MKALYISKDTFPLLVYLTNAPIIVRCTSSLLTRPRKSGRLGSCDSWLKGSDKQNLPGKDHIRGLEL